MIKKIFNEVKDIIGELFSKDEIWLFLFLLIVGGYISFLFISGVAWADIGRFFADTWMIWLFFIILPMTASAWLFYRNEYFKSKIKWTVLEIKIPRENIKSPKAMEQILAAIHSLRNAPGDLEERWWEGEVTRWYCLEMVSFGGEIHYYIRLYAKQKNLVEAAFFSYYPDVEIEEVDDYMPRLPASIEEMYRQGMDLWGTEMVLSREALYPIKTYSHFVEAEQEEKMVDPMSAFLEVLGKLKPNEFVGIQIIIAPAGGKWVFLRGTGPDWRKKWEPQLEKLREPKIKKEGGGGEGDLSSFAKFIARSPGETDILEEVENNLSKPAFDTIIRFVYVSPLEGFSDTFPRRGIKGAFNQYAALHLNSFRENYKVSTRTRFWHFPFLFPNIRNELKKQRLWRNFLKRDIPPETFMGKVLTSHLFNWNFASQTFEMNTECLATLFHLPTETVLTTPHIKRVESRKASPPAGLSIFGDEEEIEKFR